MSAVIDPGNAPEIFIEGLCHYSEAADGIVRTAFYVEQPAIDEDEPRLVKVLVLRLVYTTATQQRLRQEMITHLSGTGPKNAGFVSGLSVKN